MTTTTEIIVNTKLTINLREGILDVEGSDEFVRAIYEDFKGEVAKRQQPINGAHRQLEVASTGSRDSDSLIEETKVKPKKRTRHSAVSGEGQKPRPAKYKPTFDPSLNLKELPEFYDELSPAKASEKILIFAVFLSEKLKMAPCTADHIFTCFFTVKDRTKIPEAFEQAFRDTQSRTHYIHYETLQEISVTIPGSNHFEEMKKRKVAK